MNQLAAIFAEFFSSIDVADKRIVVAYSGGLDSSVLLHLCISYFKNRSIPLRAIHINHGISDQAGIWQTHCDKYCAKHLIPFESIEVDIKPHEHMGIEAAAREARYSALIKRCDEKDILLVAQHLDDQAETLLLQLARGAGPKGLSAMPEIKSLQGIQIMRPLLNCSREQLHQYALQHRLDWVEDDTNQCTHFDRNYLRLNISPIMKQRWPQINTQIAKSAARCAEESALVNEYMLLLSSELLDKDNQINLQKFALLSKQAQPSFIRYWLAQNSILMPSVAQLKEILSFSAAQTDRNPKILLGNSYIFRFDGKLCIRSSESVEHFGYEFFPEQQSLSNQHFLLEFCDNSKASFFVENSTLLTIQRNEKGLNFPFKPFSNRPTKPLKQWCKEWKIPPYKRSQLIKIIKNNSIVAVFTDQLLVDIKYQSFSTKHSRAILFTPKFTPL